MIKSIFAGLLIALLILVSPVQCQNPNDQRNQTSTEEPVQKKKPHHWLIGVGAALGLTFGLLYSVHIVFNDTSGEGEQKIIIVTVVSTVAGAFVGWLVARNKDKPAQMRLSLQPLPNQEVTKTFPCRHQNSTPLIQQADCMFPDYLKNVGSNKTVLKGR